jgi:hypothetical protein
MKGKKIALTVLLALVFCLVGTGAALAMSSTNYNLPWDVFSGGGIENRSSSSYILGDTVGQPSAIGPSESTNYRLGSGFWYGVTVSVTVCLPGDANEDGVVDVLDLQVEKQIIFGELPPTCGADANEDGFINVLDLVEIKRIIIGQ